MSISKKKGSPYWYTRFTIAGCRVQESTRCTSRAEAQEYEEKRRREIREELLLGRKPKRYWSDAVLRWCDEMKHKKSFDTDVYHLAWLQPRLENYTLDQIDKYVIEHIVSEKLKKCTPATVNRMLTVLKALLNKAHREWDWLNKPPIVPMQKNADIKRERWLTREEAQRLLTELPSHLEAMARFTLSTGLRASNVRKLTWPQINMSQRRLTINASQSKNNRTFSIPLNDDAIAILESQAGLHPEHVFTYKGSPVNQCCTMAWFKAVERAGIKNFRWHDLRHTWASWHVQSGTSLHELLELGGWRSFEMVMRYAHLSTSHLNEAANRLAAIKRHGAY